MAAAAGFSVLNILFKYVTIIAVFCLQIKYSESESDPPNKVQLGFIWENPRVEQHDASEVIVDGSRNELRLTCILTPSLPLTKGNYISRDNIVKWMKIEKTHGHQMKNTFWSDTQDITAISLSNLKLQNLGTYGCSYKSLLKTINITVSGIDEIKRLPEPHSHSDLEGAVLNIKNTKELATWKSLPSVQKESLGLERFPCSTFNNGMKANSVNQLRPVDIDVVLSIGGALSAGVATNAKTIPGLFRSHKTHSFSIGGKFPAEELVTLPSILKKFNPNLKGAVAKEEDFSTMHYGSSIRNLPVRVSSLIKRLQNRRDIDFASSWKLLTISLDFDDYCVACRLAMGWDDHIKAVVEALDLLHAKVPRLFVNLVLAPNVTQLYSLPSSRKCSQLYWKTAFEILKSTPLPFNYLGKQCECLESKSDDEKSKVLEMQNDFKDYLTKLVQKYDYSPNFTVVVQPFWAGIYQEMNGLFAQDCFHLSSTAQEYTAINLWNNMLQPVNRKSEQWRLSKSMRCPTTMHPYLFTSSNSKVNDDIDFSVADTADSRFPNKQKSQSKVKVALGVGLSLFVVVVVVISVFIYVRKQRPISMTDRIRILATPWKRMKEKV